jgi:predicted AAA+ superfamily ATPase
MEYDKITISLLFSLLTNAYLLFLVRSMQGREKFILKTSQEMINISEVFSSEIKQLKADTEDT